MNFRCAQGHSHPEENARDQCDARFHDARSLLKMGRVGFAGPKKIPRVYDPPRREVRDGVEVVIFSEEEIVPWVRGGRMTDAELPTAEPDDENVVDDDRSDD